MRKTKTPLREFLRKTAYRLFFAVFFFAVFFAFFFAAIILLYRLRNSDKKIKYAYDK